MVKIESSWKEALESEWTKPYWNTLAEFVRAEYMSGRKIYPSAKNIFNAFELCSIDAVNVVILGQDPYHGPKQAMGLSFSVPAGVDIPPSLVNIYKEIFNDLGRRSNTFGDLTSWAVSGVLLLNSVLTVRANEAASHAGRGWENFTDAVIRTLSGRKDIVYILWGSYAQKKGAMIDRENNLVLESAHPSPLAAHRGFFGSRPFSKANEYLISVGKNPIDW